MTDREAQEYKERLMRAREKAMRVLSASMKSTKQMALLLRREGYEEEIVSEVIDFLHKHRFLDDGALAQALAESGMKARRYSKRQAVQKLRERGLSKEDIAQSMEEIDEGQELENALYLARRKFDSLRDKPLRERLDKTGMSLSYKGFSYEVIRKSLDCLRREIREREDEE